MAPHASMGHPTDSAPDMDEALRRVRSGGCAMTEEQQRQLAEDLKRRNDQSEQDARAKGR